MQLVVMAAGMGSRFGGLKQMEPMDEAGNFLLDYSIYDAKRAGFDSVIFIIKKDFFEEFKNTIGTRASKIMKVEYAFQELEDLPEEFKVPEGREKPWGTGHAILAARDLINDDFIIINGDDYYGVDTYKVAYEYLKDAKTKEGSYANVAFQVCNTMTENGSVKRGVVFQKDGYLTKLVESSIEKVNGKIIASPLEKQYGDPFEISPDTPVSMNLFCFKKDIIQNLKEKFVVWLKDNVNVPKSEYLIPTVVDELVREKRATLKLLTTPSVWFGVTYKEDKPYVVQSLKDLTNKGVYKKGLY